MSILILGAQIIEVLMPIYAVLALAIVAEVIATSALKASIGFTRIGSTLVVLGGYRHGVELDFSRPGSRPTTPSSKPFNAASERSA